MNDSIQEILSQLENARESVINRIDKRLDKLEDKIDELQSFKWKLLGASGVVAFLITMVIESFRK